MFILSMHTKITASRNLIRYELAKKPVVSFVTVIWNLITTITTRKKESIQPSANYYHAMTCFNDLRKRKKRKTTVSLKPVLNWANVCSPNILQTVRQTMIRFLIELLVRQTWFGQSKLYFILNWLEPELWQTRSKQHDRKCRLKSIYFHHPSQGNPTNYYLILGLWDKAAPSHKSTNKQIPSEASEEPSDTVINF